MKTLTRRAMLRGVGGIAIALPLLDIMHGSGEAQPATPKRFVSFFTANGFLPHLWARPEGAEGFSVGPILEPLSDHADDLTILRGLDLTANSGGHNIGAATFLTANGVDGSTEQALGVSLDQRIAQEIGEGTRFQSLQLGCLAGGTHPHQACVYPASRAPVAANNDPASAFDRVFGGGLPPTDMLSDIRARRASILDLMGEQFADLDRMASVSDRRRLDQHREAIFQLERTLLEPDEDRAICEAPTRFGALDPHDHMNIPAISDAQIDIMAYALACDLTRVVHMQWGVNNGGYTHPFLPDLERAGNWHYVAHIGGDDGERQLTAIDSFYASKIARLVTTLKSFGGGADDVFHNTLMLWGSEISRGNHGRDTEGNNDPAHLLIGSAAGTIRTGRLLDYGGQSRTNNNLYLSILRSFGIDDETFGRESASEGGPLDLN